MRKIKSGIAAISLGCLLTAVPALAREHGELTEHVTFYEDVLVNDTLVKHGTYKLEFDPAGGQLLIKSGKKVVASAPASMRVNEKKADGDVIYTHSTEMGEALQAVKYGGQREEVVLTNTASAQAVAEPTNDVAYYEEYYYDNATLGEAAVSTPDDCDVATATATTTDEATAMNDDGVTDDSAIVTESEMSSQQDNYDAEPPVDD